MCPIKITGVNGNSIAVNGNQHDSEIVATSIKRTIDTKQLTTQDYAIMRSSNISHQNILNILSHLNPASDFQAILQNVEQVKVSYENQAFGLSAISSSLSSINPSSLSQFQQQSPSLNANVNILPNAHELLQRAKTEVNPEILGEAHREALETNKIDVLIEISDILSKSGLKDRSELVGNEILQKVDASYLSMSQPEIYKISNEMLSLANTLREKGSNILASKLGIKSLEISLTSKVYDSTIFQKASKFISKPQAEAIIDTHINTLVSSDFNSFYNLAKSLKDISDPIFVNKIISRGIVFEGLETDRSIIKPTSRGLGTLLTSIENSNVVNRFKETQDKLNNLTLDKNNILISPNDVETKIENLTQLRSDLSLLIKDNNNFLSRFRYNQTDTSVKIITSILQTKNYEVSEQIRDVDEQIKICEKQLSGVADPIFSKLLTDLDKGGIYNGTKREIQSQFVKDLAVAKFGTPNTIPVNQAFARLSNYGITSLNLDTKIDEFKDFIRKPNNSALLKVRVRDGAKHEQVPTAQISNVMLMTLLPKPNTFAFSIDKNNNLVSRLDILDRTLADTKNVMLFGRTDVSGVVKDSITLDGFIVDRHPNRRVGIDQVQDKHVPTGQTHDSYDRDLQQAAITSKNPQELLQNIIDINERYLMTGQRFLQLNQSQFVKSHYVVFDRGGTNEFVNLSDSSPANREKLVKFFNMAYIETMGPLLKMKSDFINLNPQEEKIVRSFEKIQDMRSGGDSTPRIVSKGDTFSGPELRL